MSSTTTENLFAGFSPATDAEWRKVAEESLDGAPFEKKLITRTSEGIDLQPIYSRADGDKLGGIESWPGLAPYLRGATPLGSSATGWYYCQELGCVEAAAFNTALRHDLGRGLNAVNLSLDTATRLGLAPKSAPAGQVRDTGLSLVSVDTVEAALHGVDLAAVPLFAQAGIAAPAVTRLLTDWLGRTGRSATSLHGAVLGDPFAEWPAARDSRVRL
jgi:methylmalonyl-CoA mutase